ncbi:MAG: DegT/DnrJ/EryC1/StrS family aminotransferase [Cyclobacteriaceae bacterium]
MIPVFEPSIDNSDIQSVLRALKSGEISGTYGSSISDFENQFAKYCGCKHGVSVSSGTTALHLSISALNIGPGDEVIISSSTNIATALAVYHNGAVVVPIDSEKETWNMDVDLIEKAISPNTKAIIPVHLFGHPVDMPRLMAIAEKYDLKVIEDAAEAHGAQINGKTVGSFGDMACFSFYANKIISTGEGGMIVTDDDHLAARLRKLKNLAFEQPRFYHKEAGYNFRMSGMQAALGLSQLGKIEDFIRRKRRLAQAYNSMLREVDFIETPIERSWAKNVYWMYAVTIRSENRINRDALCYYLREKGIDTRTFFCPMNRQPFLLNSHLMLETDCPIAEYIWENGFYLPSSTNLKSSEIEHICETIKDYI